MNHAVNLRGKTDGEPEPDDRLRSLRHPGEADGAGLPRLPRAEGRGRLASGRVVGPEEIGRTRRFVAFFAAAATICALTGVWFGAIACGFVSLAALVQSGSVVFSSGREYWFR